MRFFYGFCFVASSGACLLACSSSPAAPADAGHDAISDATRVDTGSGKVDASDGAWVGVDAGPVRTWDELYTQFFAPGTVGHCGNMGCHQTAVGNNSGFIVGTTSASFYAGLVQAGQVLPDEPAMSPFGDPNESPLSWFGEGGLMPYDTPMLDLFAASAVRDWVLAGAKGPPDAGVDAASDAAQDGAARDGAVHDGAVQDGSSRADAGVDATLDAPVDAGSSDAPHDAASSDAKTD